MTTPDRRRPQEKKRGAPPTKRNATTAAERDFRRGIVRECILGGKTSVAELSAALAEQGREVPERTIWDVVNFVRRALAKEDAELRWAQRLAMAKRLGDASEEMLGRLRGPEGRTPRWADWIAVERLRARVEGLLDRPDEEYPPKPDGFSKMTNEELEHFATTGEIPTWMAKESRENGV